ncbi:MAG: hypothetical protein H8F28_08550 [Fibrella sp.]|nr:hypothetical protein [Armatimonadota bacterium]
MTKVFTAFATVLLAVPSQAAVWQFSLPVSAKNAAIKVEVTPFKYGKTWAYSFEQDDSPASTLTVSQPLLARYQWNDAPPGVIGGRNHPFVGTAAVILGNLDAGNATVLTYPQIAALKKSGWGIANHSYAHSGNGWEPSQALQPDDFARELFWSQAVYAERIGAGRGAVHFVLPNGYVDYVPHLRKGGLQSSSRVAGSSPRNVFDPKYDPFDLTRTYLDEGVWQKDNDPLLDFPVKLIPGDFVTDFTHNIEADPNSANYKRWVARLNHIATAWGATGDNSVWVAPTDAVITYHLAARAATVTVRSGRVSVALPDTVPGSALTLKITGLGTTTLKTPPGATLYRRGDTAWLTTPMIGKPGVPPPTPRLRCLYAGELKNLVWDKPVALAGVRIRQFGPGSDGFVFKLDTVTPDGKIASLLPSGESKLKEVWGGWNLYPILPNCPAVLVKELRVTPGKDLNEMEVWEVVSP